MPTPQATRSERTKERLLNATLDVLAAEGMAKATTTRICQVAGVSRGAQTHHYPTKDELVIAALEYMAERYAREGHEFVAGLDPSERTIAVVVSRLWNAVLDERFGFSALEALVHARTDPALQPAVAEANNAAVEAVRSFASVITHPSATESQLADALESTLHYFRGLALSRPLASHHNDQHAKEWADALERQLRNTDQ